MGELAVVDQEVLLPEQTAPAATLFRTDDPAEVVRRATHVAQTLRRVVVKAGLVQSISGRDFPRVEAWTLCGTMLGVFPVCVWTRRLEDGWEARVEARTLAGQLVGASEAECLRSERSWRDRDDYALRSMAQTRATSKALRQPLGFVMSLAGLEATPAEEMVEQASPFQAPAAVKATAAQVKTAGKLIDQLIKAGLVDGAELAERLEAKYGSRAPGDWTRAQAEEAILGLQRLAGEGEA